MYVAWHLLHPGCRNTPIITNELDVILNTFMNEGVVQPAVTEPRIHCTWVYNHAHCDVGAQPARHAFQHAYSNVWKRLESFHENK